VRARRPAARLVNYWTAITLLRDITAVFVNRNRRRPPPSTPPPPSARDRRGSEAPWAPKLLQLCRSALAGPRGLAMSSLEENKAVAHIQDVTKAPQDACRLVWLECNKDAEMAIFRLIDSALRARGRGTRRDSPLAPRPPPDPFSEVKGKKLKKKEVRWSPPAALRSSPWSVSHSCQADEAKPAVKAAERTDGADRGGRTRGSRGGAGRRGGGGGSGRGGGAGPGPVPAGAPVDAPAASVAALTRRHAIAAAAKIPLPRAENGRTERAALERSPAPAPRCAQRRARAPAPLARPPPPSRHPALTCSPPLPAPPPSTRARCTAA